MTFLWHNRGEAAARHGFDKLRCPLHLSVGEGAVVKRAIERVSSRGSPCGSKLPVLFGEFGVNPNGSNRMQ
jgi:hypothetical protein